MKTSTEKSHRTILTGTAAALSLALALPLTARHAVATEDQGRNMADTILRETTRDQPATSLRFTAARPTERATTVTWADLDLSRPAGLDRLYQRLSGAITNVCGPREHIRNIAGNRDRKACMERAMHNAVRNVGHRGLEEVHASRTGRSLQPGQQTASR
jgi:UrcA family protein